MQERHYHGVTVLIRLSHISFLFTVSVLVLAACNEKQQAQTVLFDGTRALELVEKQVAFGPRVPGTDGHRLAAKYFLDYLGSYADTVYTDRWQHDFADGITRGLVNVIASFNPQDNRRVLLCAHWDTRPRAEHDPNPELRDKPIPGANDGGSGVAVLLELARVFKENPPTVGVDLVLFDGEDYGDFHKNEDVLIGSTRFAEVNKGYRPGLGVLLDIVGDKNAKFPYEGHSWQWLGDDCSLIWNTAANLGYGHIFVKQVGPTVVDDHIPLLNAGIRCIDIIQMGLPYWHTQGDTPDKLSAESLEAVGRTLAEVIHSLN